MQFQRKSLVAASIVMAMALVLPGCKISVPVTPEKNTVQQTADAPSLPGYKISGPASPTPQEKEAMQELEQYLAKTVKTMKIAGKPAGTFYVGNTEFAEKNGVKTRKMAPDAWVIKNVGADVILAGGGYRGSLYAVCHFLEDYLGVHWLTPEDEYVPVACDRDFISLNRTGKPFFEQRSFYQVFYNANDNRKFLQRNRWDDNHDWRMGGNMAYGSPYLCHTFGLYIPAETYLATHPEYFSLVNGKRVGDQLCLTCLDVRKIFKEKLRQYILQDEKRAATNNIPAPKMYNIMPNDNMNFCQCAKCAEFVKANGNQTDLLFDFVNEIAADLKQFRPELYLDTAAYGYHRAFPRTVKPAGNVIIRYAELGNESYRLEHPWNVPARDSIIKWSTLAKKLYIWDYNLQLTPTSLEWNIPADIKFLATNNVTGIFSESSSPDMFDLRIWLLGKYVEDPFRNDFQDLYNTFMTEFYGAAAPHLDSYRQRVRRAIEENPMLWSGKNSTNRGNRSLSLKEYLGCYADFAAAEKAVAGDPELLRRVRWSRRSLDYLTCEMSRWYAHCWEQEGHALKDFPLDVAGIQKRLVELMEEKKMGWRMKKMGIPELIKLPTTVPAPARFKGQKYMDFTPETFGKTVADQDAEIGYASRVEVLRNTPNRMNDDVKTKRYSLPLIYAYYDFQTKRHIIKELTKDDIGVPGYHWYKFEGIEPSRDCILYFSGQWHPSVEISDAVSFAQGKPLTFWFRLKLEGPLYYAGDSRTNAVYLERVVAVREQKD